MTKVQHGKRSITRVADRFEAVDVRAPFKVFLHHAVNVTVDAETGEQLSYSIPDPDGLRQAITMTRCLHPRKFSGADLKFLRKSVELQQKELAQKMDLSVEYLSRCENNAVTLSPQTEKLIRIYLIKTTLSFHNVETCEAEKRLDSAISRLFEIIKPIGVFDASDVLTLNFSRGKKKQKNAAKICEEGHWNEDDLLAA